jgi:hypothetical protein
MASVRISGNWRNPNKIEWGGAPEIDTDGRIERTIDMPEAAYRAIEQAIAAGNVDGTIQLDRVTRVNWSLDR